MWFHRMLLKVLVLGMSLACSVVCSAGEHPCLTCHADKVVDKAGRTVHMAEASDDCKSCHQLKESLRHPHDKEAVTRPSSNSGALCLRCHEEEKARYIHAPVAAGECTSCHVPHRAPSSFLLKKKGAALCHMCHEEGKLRQKYQHGPVAGGNCLFCHDPHSSENRKLLKKFGSFLCFECHDRELAKGNFVHEPVGYGDCVGCHSIHGSSYRKILNADFSDEFYLSYQASNYALCFLCHSRELVENPTTDVTDFRNGTTNLHYLHVNKADHGRSCKACHDAHAATQHKLIKESVPGFGSWSIPMFFSPTPVGGTCVVGCHKPKAYDRTSPVSYW
ncbi:cytochrome c3 family protein [Geobacter sp. DSM 9736]|uniref:cytochrome c3 family protein n=1 Tax=Geobacter sp. DSM 9736 TaxID=1277350 RepID=UPI000B505701|nr:cytochrome c3 family protein [Geobacter sp. DSM 9736]SNB46644.1 doubled CXXCH domain-containing protein [Geobacter sp. DSM 9736]